eukprot:gene5542-5597_t
MRANILKALGLIALLAFPYRPDWVRPPVQIEGMGNDAAAWAATAPAASISDQALGFYVSDHVHDLRRSRLTLPGSAEEFRAMAFALQSLIAPGAVLGLSAVVIALRRNFARRHFGDSADSSSGSDGSSWWSPGDTTSTDSSCDTSSSDSGGSCSE